MSWFSFFKKQTRLPQPPEGHRVYAVGDIHGRADLLDLLIARIDAELNARERCDTALIFLGDYVDRGPASKAVIERLIEVSGRYKTTCLKGNHEAFLLTFLSSPASLTDWRLYGGLTTLMSYGLRPPLNPTPRQCSEMALELIEALPKPHLAFLQNLGLYLSLGDFFFVHAGVRPGIALDRQSPDDLLWIRDDFLHHGGKFEKMIVHGHTPVKQPDILSNRINIDTGAYATGKLTCLVLEGEHMRFL